MWNQIEEPLKNIYQVSSLRKFYDNYPIATITRRLKEYEDYFPSYRRVKGDGHCFYRSFAFLYIRNSKFDSLQELFPYVPYNCSSFPFQQGQSSCYYEILRQYWRKNLREIMQMKDISRKEKAIEKLFNGGNEQFDALIVGYLRSVCFQNLKQNEDKFISYVEDQSEWKSKLMGVQNDEYASGIEINSILNFFKVGLTCIEVKETGVQPIYFNQYENQGYFMIFRSEHYEIIYPAQNNYEFHLPDQYITGSSYILEKKKSNEISNSSMLNITPDQSAFIRLTPLDQEEIKPVFRQKSEFMKSEKNHVKIDEIPKENEKKIYVSRSIGDTIYRTVVDTGSIAVVAAFAYALFF